MILCSTYRTLQPYLEDNPLEESNLEETGTGCGS